MRALGSRDRSTKSGRKHAPSVGEDTSRPFRSRERSIPGCASGVVSRIPSDSESTLWINYKMWRFVCCVVLHVQRGSGSKEGARRFFSNH